MKCLDVLFFLCLAWNVLIAFYLPSLDMFYLLEMFPQICNCFFLCSVVLASSGGCILVLGVFSPSTSVNISSMISSSQSFSPAPNRQTNHSQWFTVSVFIFTIKDFYGDFDILIFWTELPTLLPDYVSLLSVSPNDIIMLPFIESRYSSLALWFLLFTQRPRILASHWWYCDSFYCLARTWFSLLVRERDRTIVLENRFLTFFLFPSINGIMTGNLPLYLQVRTPCLYDLQWFLSGSVPPTLLVSESLCFW